jgi:hypothetical protein
MIQQLEIESAAGANLVLVQHLEHAPEADAIAVVNARVVRNVRLHRTFSGRYSKNSMFGATQNATRALPGHLMMGRSVIGA